MAQINAVWTRAHSKAKPKPPTSATWQALVDRTVGESPARHRSAVAACKALALPDPQTFAALSELAIKTGKAVKALERQIAFAAAMQGVSVDAAQKAFQGFRATPTGMAPPETWVRGFTNRDTMAMSAPADPATLAALYRLQADPWVFQNTPRLGYASIDLETAGPPGKTGFDPVNGCIIEVAILLYDQRGRETGRVAGLVAGDPQVINTHGTGSVEIHRITMADLAGQPTWDRVAPAVAVALQNRVAVIQNAYFERTWLSYHMPAVGVRYDRGTLTVDTLNLAKQHFPDLPDYKLSTACAAIGVPYTIGHRAEHDARAAAALFFALRSTLRRNWIEHAR